MGMIERLRGLGKGSQDKVRSVSGKKDKRQSGEALHGSGNQELAKGFCNTESSKGCVTVCTPKPGCTCGAEAVRAALVNEIKKRQLPVSVGNAKTGCSGKCKNGPFIGFPQRGFFYLSVHQEDVAEVVEETLMRGHILFNHLSISPDRSYRTDVYYEKHTGVLAAIDDSVCMVDVAKYFLDFEEGLSCGKCIPCRLGMKRMQECVDRIVSGEGSDQDLEQIEILCQAMIAAPYCDFAVTSSRPVLSAITYFRDEFNAHVERRECPARVCGIGVTPQKAAGKPN
jgi:(2Fe-2S) ferredoxin